MNITFTNIFGPLFTPFVEKKYRCIGEIENKQDKKAIAVVQEERIVGHIPTAVSKEVYVSDLA